MAGSARGVKIDEHEIGKSSIHVGDGDGYCNDDGDGDTLYLSDDLSGTFQSLRRTSHAKLPRERRLRRAIATFPRTIGLPRFLSPRTASRAGSALTAENFSHGHNEHQKRNEDGIQMSSRQHSLPPSRLEPYFEDSRLLEIRAASEAHSFVGRMPQSARAFSVNVDQFAYGSSYAGSDFGLDSGGVHSAYYTRSTTHFDTSIGAVDESQSIAGGFNFDEGSPVNIIYDNAHQQSRAHRLAKMRRAFRLRKQNLSP